MGFIIADTSCRWPYGLIPYEIAPGFGSNESTILLAMRIWETSTHGAIRFRPREGEDDYLFVVSAGGISRSQIGRISGRQFIRHYSRSRFVGRYEIKDRELVAVSLGRIAHRPLSPRRV